MNRLPVASSNINSIGYDPELKTLEVEFKNGGVYHYHGVEPEAHQSLLNSPSVGKHLNEHIKSNHKFTKLENI